MEELKQKYAFVLGREIELCLEEVRAVFEYFGFSFAILSVTDNIAIINTTADIDRIRNIAERTAGVVKVFSLDKTLGDKSDLQHQLFSLLKSDSFVKDFAVSSYSQIGKAVINKLGFSVKMAMKRAGRNIRFVELRDNNEVASALSKCMFLDKKREYGVIEDKGILSLGRLIWAYDIDSWSQIDYGKPRSDKFSGMLPPKLARMMINLALGQIEGTGDKELGTGKMNDNSLPRTTSLVPRPLIADPFCGSGNILIEAVNLGLDCFGSDISDRAVADSKTNLEWLSEKLKVKAPKGTLRVQNYNLQFKIEKIDATSSELTKNYSLQTTNYDNLIVVTEPFLGKPKQHAQNYSETVTEYADIKKLYLDFLCNLLSLKTKNYQLKTVLCIVFPVIETFEGQIFDLYDESVDEIKKLGYIELVKPLLYGREYQIVKRKIVLLGTRNEEQGTSGMNDF